ncbi:MAG: hypothetical protein K5780_06580 [Alphaproteobacteria bacterium]|nr:hypothetical protein [Alphaproteobacteria bacterium]
MIDLVIVVLCLFVTLVAGIFTRRNVKNMKDFSVSAKIFLASVLVSTIFATWMGGDDPLDISDRIYSVGLAFLIIQLTQAIGLFFHAYIVAPKVIQNLKTDIRTYLINMAVGFVSIVIFRYSVPDDYVVISQIVGACVTVATMLVLGNLGTLSRPYDSGLVISRA